MPVFTNQYNYFRWLCWFVFVPTVVSALGENPERPLRLMSWNVKNYNLCDRYVHDEYRRDYPKPEFEKDALRSVVVETNPDILIIQEIGGDPFLKELSEDLKRGNGMNFPYHGIVEAADKQRRVGVLSKFEFRLLPNKVTEGDRFSYMGKKLPVKRGLLEIELEYRDTVFVIMGVHLKSRYTSHEDDSESRIRREKEARLIRDYIRRKMIENPVQPLLLMGDLNDHAASPVYRRFTTISGRSLLNELRLADSKGECWTYFHKAYRRYEQIDFIFANDALLKGAFVLKGGIVDSPDVVIASDHRPIIVDIQSESFGERNP